MAGVKGRSGGARRGTGPKPFAPTEEQRIIVEIGASCGYSDIEIVQRIKDPKTKQPISVQMLRKHFERELAFGLAMATLKVARKLLQVALDGNVDAMKFWLKTRAKWTEAPLDINSKVDLTVNADEAKQRAIESIREAFLEATGEPMPPGRLN